MRTNVSGLALSIGMGLIVLLLGFAVLSAAGLVGFAAADVAAEPTMCGNVAEPMPAQETATSTRFIPATASASTLPADAEAMRVGDMLFKNNCAQCHAINEKVVGPALAGITKRRSISWLIPWVKNSSKVIAAGDEYAIKLYEDNGKQQMPAFPQLTDKEIKSIIVWVEANEGVSVAIAYNQATVQ